MSSPYPSRVPLLNSSAFESAASDAQGSVKPERNRRGWRRPRGSRKLTTRSDRVISGGVFPATIFPHRRTPVGDRVLRQRSRNSLRLLRGTIPPNETTRSVHTRVGMESKCLAPLTGNISDSFGASMLFDCGALTIIEDRSESNTKPIDSDDSSKHRILNGRSKYQPNECSSIVRLYSYYFDNAWRRHRRNKLGFRWPPSTSSLSVKNNQSWRLFPRERKLERLLSYLSANRCPQAEPEN